jgi:uncharacterized membrane protein
MWNMIWPILVVVGANTIYNISAKSTPANVNSFASLAVSYAIGMALCLVMFYITSENKRIFAELSKTNWTTLVLSVAIVALEFGYICIYRAGWKISVATLIANISLACVLIIVGLLLYKESISPRQIVGILVSAIGLILIAK